MLHIAVKNALNDAKISCVRRKKITPNAQTQNKAKQKEQE